jgi:hypothetical protein
MSLNSQSQQPLKFTPNQTVTQATKNFLVAADDYSTQGMNCFNTCIDKFEIDSLLGYEKRCMQGCLQVNFQMFTVNATQM